MSRTDAIIASHRFGFGPAAGEVYFAGDVGEQLAHRFPLAGQFGGAGHGYRRLVRSLDQELVEHGFGHTVGAAMPPRDHAHGRVGIPRQAGLEKGGVELEFAQVHRKIIEWCAVPLPQPVGNRL